MIIISHRANLNGPDKNRENKPECIDECLNLGYDVEIDLRLKDHNLFLGHDESEHEIDISFLLKRANSLWIHCKNIDALYYLDKYDLNYFWHENDSHTLTSKKFIWTFPNNILTKKSICVMPEIQNISSTNMLDVYGICSDFPIKYKKDFK